MVSAGGYPVASVLSVSQQEPTGNKNPSEPSVGRSHDDALLAGRIGGWFAYINETGSPDGLVPAEEKPRVVEGTVGLMVDDCIEFPLWDRRGPIEESDDWLHEHLGISYDLIADLHRLLDDYWNGVFSEERQTVLWGRLEAELKPHLRAP
jgi:hypothetical protein